MSHQCQPNDVHNTASIHFVHLFGLIACVAVNQTKYIYIYIYRKCESDWKNEKMLLLTFFFIFITWIDLVYTQNHVKQSAIIGELRSPRLGNNNVFFFSYLCPNVCTSLSPLIFFLLSFLSSAAATTECQDVFDSSKQHVSNGCCPSHNSSSLLSQLGCTVHKMP